MLSPPLPSWDCEIVSLTLYVLQVTSCHPLMTLVQLCILHSTLERLRVLVLNVFVKYSMNISAYPGGKGKTPINIRKST